MKHRLTALVCALLFLFSLPLPTFGISDADPASLSESIEEYKLADAGVSSLQDWLDHTLADETGTGSEWYAFCLAQRYGDLDFTAYAEALLRRLNTSPSREIVSNLRSVLVLTAAGVHGAQSTEALLESTVGQQGIMSWVYGLHLLNNGLTSDAYTAEEIIDTLLGLQLDDGGWALYGEQGDVDVTAMTLSALAPHADDERVAAAAVRAMQMLSDRQLDTGGYQSFGNENPESSAQVIIALASFGVDCRTDARFLKNGCSPLDGMLLFRLENGSFCHDGSDKSNDAATVQAYEAFTALERLEQGATPLYVLDARSTTLPDGVMKNTEPTAAPTASLTPTPSPATASSGNSGGYKLWVCGGTLALAVIACLILFLRGKRRWKNYAAVGIAAALICAVTLLTTVQCAGDYYVAGADKPDAVGTVTITIRCDTVAGETSDLPADGVILPETEFALNEGETVYDILVEAAKTYHIPMENSGANAGSNELAYIRGISTLYEYDYGDLSGWVYRVNGETPSYGCGAYVLSDGDRIEWLYSRELGNDLDSSR